MKLKNKLAGLLSLSLLLGVLTVSSSAIDRENDVEFVLEMVTRTPGSEYAWNTDGGRETKIVSNKVRERVWGWSTCYDKYEQEARHYTHSRYEHFLSGGSCDEWSSGRVWGTGKVWAYSPYISDDAASELQARVYYGL